MKQDRLHIFENNFARKTKRGTQLFWMKYNPDNEYKFDLIDAREDIEWMVAEIKRLRSENSQLKEFIDSVRDQLKDEMEASS